MRKPTNLRLILLTLFLLQSYFMLAQNHIPFTSRFDTSIRGDMMLIGNSIVNRDNAKTNELANDAYTGTTDNNSENMQYVDIDNDPDTFSSSSASLKVPDASRACYKIVYAGLYWSGVYTQNSLDNKTVKRSDLGEVKFKLANETTYKNITGTLIYDYYNNTPKTTNGDQIPYAYYFDATDLVKASKNPEGEYTVANINAARGRLTNGGYAAGWSLFVIYEDPNSSAKYITAYDGFSWIKSGGAALTYSVSGFKTIPTGNVKVKLAFAALEGDANTKDDTYSVNGTQVFTTERKTNNFFCSVINDLSGINLLRKPASTNTLGFDAGIIDLNNTNNAIIKNGANKADLKLTTSGDGYGVYFNAFNVEVIAPNIALTKIVKDTDGNDIGGKNVTLGQQLRYEISIQNKGNDDATSLVITDQLPINVIFDQTKDLLPLPAGIIVKTPYDPITRKIVFEVTDPKLITRNNPTVSTIAFKVQVVPDCHSLSEACSNSIDNQAFATYKGKENTNFSIDETAPQGSVNSTEGCAVTPKATNFLVGIDGCQYTENVTLCTDSVDLIAAKGYEKYTWYSDAAMTNKIGEGNPFNVTKEGTYYVYNLAAAPCRSISQSFVVTRFKSTSPNPVLPFASEVVTCADTGKPFPNIYLCGGNAKKEIKTNILDASNIVWERFVEGSCTVATGKNCPNEALASTGNPSELCKWDQVGTGSDYTASAKGKYRLTVTYKGGVCFNRFYFDVYKNDLTPTEKHTDIICSTNGSITVEGVPDGYEYAISKDPSGTIGAYQPTNVFPISTPGSYTVHVRQTNVTTFPCDFTVENILIRKRDIDVKTVIKQPLCAGAKGSVDVAANNVNPNYTFVITQGNTTVQSVGPISQNNTKFDLLAGDYVLTVTTADGCSNISDINIVAPDPLTATYDVKSLTACSDGEITINPKGGTSPYFYSINGEPFVSSDDKITVKSPGGSYSIIVADSNDCLYTIPTFSVTPIAKPTVTINSKNLSCYNTKEGEISITVTPADSGYTVSYSVAGVAGGAYTTLPTTGLPAGDYKVTVKYTINGAECTDPEKIIKITGPAAALTASAGVAELSGCGPTGNTKQGMVRITNPQGGVPFSAPNLYRYSFDGGDTYITDNFAYINPSITPLTFYIKDAAGCVFEMSGIILDEKPADPTFSDPVLTYNCKGEGTATVTVNADASPNYNYSYYLGKPDPANPSNYIYTLNTNSPANIFKDIPVGDYKIKVEYNLVSAPTYSNLLSENFGNGDDTTSPGINNVYCFEKQDAITDCDKLKVWHPWLMNDGEYTVTKGILTDHDSDFGWIIPKDHTNAPGITDGRYLAINIGGVQEGIPVGTVIYSKPIHDVIPKQDVKVTFYALNLLKSSNAKAAPDLTIELSKNGTAVPGASVKTTKISQNEQWNKIELTINPGDNTDLDFVIKTNIAIVDGSDLAIDDILVYQLPKSCLQDKTLSLSVKSGLGFTAEVTKLNGVKCKGDANGTFSIVATNFDTKNGFWYTLNGSATTPTWVNSKVSPVDFTDKPAGTYDIRVKYDNSAASCNFTIPTIVKTPDAFVVDASATTATCKVGATVTATAVGGTENYTLVIKDKNSVFTKTFPSDGILKDIPPGTYTVSGTDANGCLDARDTDLVIATPEKPKAEVTQNTGLCFGTNAKITVTITGGVGKYSYQVSTNGGVTYSTPSPAFDGPSFNYIATAPGTYDFLITDSNNCEAIAVSQKIDKKITAIADVTAPLSCITGSTNATIKVTIDGGTSPYTYTVTNKATNTVLFTSGSITGPTFTYSAATAGIYVFDIKDKNSCPLSVEKEVLAKVAVTATHKVENVTCFNKADGYIDITPQNGVAPFKIQFNGTGAFTTVTTTPVRYGSLAGSVGAGTKYTYIVQDALGCEQQYTFYVIQPAAVTLTASITTPYNCNTGAATITASASNGNGGFTYVLKNTTTGATIATNTTGIFNNLTIPGSYDVTATDSKSCPITKTAGTINALNPPKGMTLTPGAVTCPSNATTVTITNVVNAAGVAVPTTGLEYRIKLPVPPGTSTYQPSNTFTGLAAGVTYTFEVRDANFCVYEKTLNVPSLSVFTVSLLSQNEISCSTSTDGKATFTVTGLGNGTGYSYKVDALPAVTGQTSPATGSSFEIAVTGLSSGLHKIVVTNTTTTCTQSQTVTIAAPPAPLVLNASTIKDVTCDNKGTATINVVGGWGTYEYTIKPTSPVGTPIVQTTNLFSNLNAGDYSVSVKDLNGCTVTGNFTINDKVNPTASIDLVNSDFCLTGSGATIKVSPNAAPNYTYTLNGVTQSNGTFTNVIPGDHKITVKDTSTGCTVELTVPTIASPIKAEIALDKDLDCVTGASDAIIKVFNIADGYPGYSYKVNTTGAPFTGASTPITGTFFTYPTGTAATYYFEITDTKGCKTVVSQKVNTLVKPVVTAATPTAVKCKGDATGTVTVTTNPAAGTYTYTLTPVAPTTGTVRTQTTSNVFNGVKAGTYNVTVTDPKSCTSLPVSVTVAEPAIVLSATASVTTKLKCGTNNAPQAATITVTAINGTPFAGGKYKYDYGDGNGFVDSNTFSTTNTGLISITVKDKNDCTTTASTTIIALNPPKALDVAQVGVISCDPAELDADLKLTVTDGVAPFRFEITSTNGTMKPAVTGINTQTHTFTNLAPGKYYFLVTDANGCTKDAEFTINSVSPITATGGVDTNVSCNGVLDGKIKFTVGGYITGGYSYTLVGSVSGTITGKNTEPVPNTILFSGLKGGETYTFTVTNDVTKCNKIVKIPLSQPTAIINLKAVASKVFCAPTINSTIKVTATGGNGPLQFAVVKSGDTPVAGDYNTTGIFTKDTNADGLNYDAYVKDANGNCSQNIPVSVVRDAAPTVDPITVACYTGVGTPLSITMSGTVYGGTKWYGINGVYSTNPVKTISGPGSYNLTMKDDNGCISAVEVLKVNDKLTLTVTPVKDATCSAVPPSTTDAVATLSASGGDNTTYVYGYRLGTVGAFTTMPGNTFNMSALGAGDYYFQVTSGGCSAVSTVPFTVTSPTPPVIDAVATGTLCTLSKEGTIQISVTSGGTFPFTYTIDNWATSNSTGYFTDLPGGTGAGLGYTYKVRDAKGCEVTGTTQVFVKSPDPITFSTAIASIQCDPTTIPPGSTYGSITVTGATGGTGQYVYYISNTFGYKDSFTTTTRENHKFDIIDYGIYTVEVRDINSCSSTKEEIMASPPNDLLIDITTASTCTDGGTAILTAVALVPGGNYEFGILETNTRPYTTNYTGPDVPGGIVKTFKNLIPGVAYTFVVHDKVTNCYYMKPAPVISPASTLVGTPAPQNVTCMGNMDGKVTFTITGVAAATTSVDYQIFRALDNFQISSVINIPITTPFTVTYPGTLVPGRYYIVFTEKVGLVAACQSASTVFEIKESTTPLLLAASSFKNDNCKPNAGIVTSQASGGAGSFLYQIKPDTGVIGDSDDPKPTVASFLSTFTTSTFYVDAGDYLVWVKDANNCIVSATVKITEDPIPVFGLTVVNLCAADGSFAVNVAITNPVPSMAPYTVSINGGNPQNVTSPLFTYVASGLKSGTQTIVVRDKNDCPETHTIDITPTPIAVASIDKVLKCPAPGTTVDDASIEVVITKGTAPFSYTVTKNGIAVGGSTLLSPLQTTFLYPVDEADYGEYVFTITDANNCPVESNPVTIDAIVPIVPDATPTPALCFGGSGTIELSATGGQKPYKYSFNSSPLDTKTTFTASGSVAGTSYSYSVQDALGCTVTSSVILFQPTELIIDTPTITELTCGPGNVGQDAKVVLSAHGGTGTYEYSFNNSDFTTEDTYYVSDIKADQTITYSIRDANKCPKSSTVTIFKLDPPIFDKPAFTQTTITCLDITSTVKVVSTKGIGAKTYAILSPSSQVLNTSGLNTGVFTLLPAGDYVFEVTDSRGCKDQAPYTVKDVIKIEIKKQSTTNITCSTATDGKASFLVSGFGTGVGTYRYEIDGVAVTGNFTDSTINLTGLAAKTGYKIEVFDNETGCSMPLLFDILAPPSALTVATPTVTPRGCTTFGAVTLIASGGWGDYTYTLTQPDLIDLTNDNGKFAGLDQIGLYNYSVKDANGCPVTGSFRLDVPVPPVASIAASDYCYTLADKATLVITATPGTGVGPFDYSIDNGKTWSTSDTFSDLGPGDYSIKVRDEYGCISAAVTTTIKGQLYASTEIRKEIFCTGIVSGTIRVSATGGYPAYSYTVAINNGTPSAPIPFVNGTYSDYTVVSPLTSTYDFVVYDANSCPMPAGSVIMVAPTAVTFTAKPTSPYCSGTQGNVNNGSILFTLPTSNDNPPYTYSIQRTAPTPGSVITQVNNPLFTGLSAGTYTVNVTSDRKCDAPTSITIDAPTPVLADAKASPFTCSGTNTLNETIVTVTGKFGAGTGLVGDYTYSNNGTNWKPTNTFKVIDNQSVQNLTYYVKDANGCIDDVQIQVNPFPILKPATVTRVTKAACNNAGEVINVVINGGASPANFQYEAYQDGVLLSGGPYTVTGNTFNYTAPTPGHFYQFKITDLTTLCSITTDPYEVPVFNTAKVIANASSSVSCNGLQDGKITFNIVDYNGPYTYQVFNNGVAVTGASGSGTTASANPFTIPFGLQAGAKYTVVITETGYPNCDITSADVNISEPPVLDVTTMAVTVKNQNCWTTGAVITADASTIIGGTPGAGFKFAFVPTGTSPAGLYTSSNTKTIATTKVAPAFDAYDVYVQDANGCPAFKTVNISLDPKPVITNVTVASQCYNAAGYRIDVVANGVGTLQYSLDGVQFTTDNFFTVKAAGNYTVTVKDANQCTTQATTPVTVLDPLTLRAEVKLPTCRNNDGEITLIAAGGTQIPAPNYVYTMDNWATTSTSNVFTLLTPGTYNFIVRDVATGCETKLREVIIDPTDVTGIVAKATPVSCNGFIDGSISVTIGASNNNPEYTYALAGPVNRAAQDSPIFNDLPFGSYIVTVTSGRGCSATAPANVGQPALIVVGAPTVTQYTCSTGTNAAVNATITVTPGSVTGGSLNYIRYEFIRDGIQVQNDDRNTFVESDFKGGDYIINVYDDNGCEGSYSTVTIAPYVGIADLDITVTKINCKDTESINVTANSTGGTLPTLTYTIVGIDGNAYPLTPSVTGFFGGLTVGNYKIVVTNPVTGCSIERFHIVNEPNTFKFVASDIKNLTCYSDEDGAITLTLVDNITTPKDDAGRFSYVITHESGTVQSGATTTTELKLSNLKRGTYTVVATLLDLPFCPVETQFSIDGPATELEIKASKKDITCITGNDDGEIRISAQGGWSGDYLYKLDGPVTVDFSTQNIFSGLKAGLYTVSVKDAGGCIDTDQVRLVIPTPIVVTASSDKTLLLCNGDLSATITATLVTGGQGSNYLYTLNTTSVTPVRSSGPQTTPSFAGLGAGTYTVTVTDGYNCIGESAPITITEPSEVKPSLVESRKRTCLTDTELTLSALGGTPPYTYSSDNITYSTVPFTSSVSFDVAPGVYKYYVKDANECVDFVSNEITIKAVEPLLANLDVTNAVVLCREDASGVIVANASGGLGNYQYILQDGAGNILKGPQSEGRFADLLAGDYKVVVKSGDCETLPESVTIDQPQEVFSAEFIPTPVKCFGGNDGQIEVIGKGGTGNYKYSISPRNDQYFDSNIFEKLKAGFYTVIATDEHGCYDTEVVEVKQPSAPLSVVETPGMTMPEQCVGDLNGAFTIDLAGGTPPYMVSLNNINGPYLLVTGTQHTFDNLPGRIHTVFVKDNGNCPQELDINVPMPVDMKPIAKVDYGCETNTVTVSIDPSVADADVDYILDDPKGTTYQFEKEFKDVAPGTHIIYARHSNGCIQPTQSFDIERFDKLTMNIISAGVKEMNVIEVQGVGGKKDYLYSFNGEPFTSSNKYNVYKSGIYQVIVRDQNGCEFELPVPMKYVDVCLDNYFTPGGSTNTEWGPGCTNIYTNLIFSIFDRYGREIAKYRYGQKWDGKYNGEELPSGDYWYVLKLNDEKDAREFVGHFTLYR